MTFIEQAIQEAVEKGGYITEEMSMFACRREITDTSAHVKKGVIHFKYTSGDNKCGADIRLSVVDRNRLFLDPAFWQALGKARGWIAPPSGQAYFYQHRFIDHLTEGKDAQSFFAELLK